MKRSRQRKLAALAAAMPEDVAKDITKNIFNDTARAQVLARARRIRRVA